MSRVPLDFDRSKHEGCVGWSFADAMPFFQRMESCAHGDPNWRGKHGPLFVKQGDFKSAPLNEASLDAGFEAGYTLARDFNGSQREGVGRLDQTIRNGIV